MTLTILVASWAAGVYLAIACFVATIVIRDDRSMGTSWTKSIALGLTIGMAWPVFVILGLIVE